MNQEDRWEWAFSAIEIQAVCGVANDKRNRNNKKYTTDESEYASISVSTVNQYPPRPLEGSNGTKTKGRGEGISLQC